MLWFLIVVLCMYHIIFHGNEWFCIGNVFLVLDGFALYYMILHGTAWYSLVLHDIVWYYITSCGVIL